MEGKRKIVVLDGGTGQSLSELGYPEVDTDPLWSAVLVKTKPEAIVNLHKQFYESGADVVVSATYQASIEGYAKRFDVTRADAAKLVTEGVHLARKARDEIHKETGKRRWVAGSVGPYGAILCDRSEYHGKYAEKMTANELTEWHKERLAAIVAGGPDLLAVETVPVQKEAEAILEALKAYPQCKAWISFQCKDGQHTGHGERLSEAVRSVLHYDGLLAVGVNCTEHRHITPLLHSLTPLALTLPVLVKPNKGEGQFGSSEMRSDAAPTLESQAREWIDLGASWLGGCCQYQPGDIRALHAFLDSQPDISLPGLQL